MTKYAVKMTTDENVDETELICVAFILNMSTFSSRMYVINRELRPPVNYIIALLL